MIWCVEDDAGIREIELYTLRAAGFEVRAFADGASFWEALKNERPELILLDVMLPGLDGMELLHRLRQHPSYASIPVIMATAKGNEADRLQGFDFGADDYLVKPFSMMEMVARVKAVLKRCAPATKELGFNGLRLDSASHKATLDGERLPLTHKEFKLLEFLLSHHGIAFSREQLLIEIWGQDYYSETRTVDMHIRTLRQKLGAWGECIETVRGVGYRLEKLAWSTEFSDPS